MEASKLLQTVCEWRLNSGRQKGVTRSQGPDKKTYRINLLRGWTFCTHFTSGLYFSTTAVHLRTHQEIITPHERHSEAPRASNNIFQNPPPCISGPQIISSVHSSLSHMQHRGGTRGSSAGLFTLCFDRTACCGRKGEPPEAAICDLRLNLHSSTNFTSEFTSCIQYLHMVAESVAKRTGYGSPNPVGQSDLRWDFCYRS